MYRFHKYRDEWRYSHKTWNASKPVDIFALEHILGVLGGPEVIVVREQPGSGQVYHINIKNGFIDKVEAVDETFDDEGLREGVMVPVQEFLATEITL